MEKEQRNKKTQKSQFLFAQLKTSKSVPFPTLPSSISYSDGQQSISGSYSVCSSILNEQLKGLITVDSDFCLSFKGTKGKIQLSGQSVEQSFSAEVIKYFNKCILNKQFHDSLKMKAILQHVAMKSQRAIKSSIVTLVSLIDKNMLFEFFQIGLGEIRCGAIILFYNNQIHQLISLEKEEIKLRNLVTQQEYQSSISQFYCLMEKLYIGNQMDYQQRIAQDIYYKMKEFTIGFFQQGFGIQPYQTQFNLNNLLQSLLFRNIPQKQQKWILIDMMYSKNDQRFIKREESTPTCSLYSLHNQNQWKYLASELSPLLQPKLDLLNFKQFILSKYYSQVNIFKFMEPYKKFNQIKGHCFLIYISLFQKNYSQFEAQFNIAYRELKEYNQKMKIVLKKKCYFTKKQLFVRLFEIIYKKNVSKLIGNQYSLQTFVSFALKGQLSLINFQYYSFGKHKIDLKHLKAIISRDIFGEVLVSCHYQQKFGVYYHNFDGFVINPQNLDQQMTIETLFDIEERCKMIYGQAIYSQEQKQWLFEREIGNEQERNTFFRQKLLNITIFFPSSNIKISEYVAQITEEYQTLVKEHKYLCEKQDLTQYILTKDSKVSRGQPQKINSSFSCTMIKIKQINQGKYKEIICQTIKAFTYCQILYRVVRNFGIIKQQQNSYTAQLLLIVIFQILRKQDFQLLFPQFIKLGNNILILQQAQQFDLMKTLKNLLTQLYLKIKHSIIVETVLKYILIYVFRKSCQDQGNKDKMSVIIKKIMQKNQYELIKISSDRIPNLQFIKKLFYNLEVSFKQNEIVEEQVYVFFSSKSEAFAIVDYCKQYFTVKYPNTKYTIPKDYFELFNALVQSFSLEGQDYLYTSIYFLYIPKAYNFNQGTGQKFKKIVQRVTDKIKKKYRYLCDFNFRCINIKNHPFEQSLMQELQFQTPNFKRQVETQRLRQSNAKELRNEIYCRFLFSNVSDKKTLYNSLIDWLNSPKNKKQTLYKPIMQHFYGVQKTLICVIVTVFNSLLNLKKNLLLQIININLADEVIQLNYYKAVQTSQGKSYYRHSIYEPISEHFLRIIKTIQKETHLSIIWNQLLKSALITMINRLITNGGVVGFNERQLLQLLLGQRHFSMRFNFTLRNTETNHKEIIRSFLNFQNCSQFGRYQSFSTFHYDNHCSRLISQKFHQLPEYTIPYFIPYGIIKQDIEDYNNRIKFINYSDIKEVRMGLGFHLIMNNPKINIGEIKEKVKTQFLDVLFKQVEFIQEAPINEEYSSVNYKLKQV